MTGQKEGIPIIYKDVIEKWAKDVESYDRFSARKCSEFLAAQSFSAVEESMYPSIWLAELKQVRGEIENVCFRVLIVHLFFSTISLFLKLNTPVKLEETNFQLTILLSLSMLLGILRLERRTTTWESSISTMQSQRILNVKLG